MHWVFQCMTHEMASFASSLSRKRTWVMGRKACHIYVVAWLTPNHDRAMSTLQKILPSIIAPENNVCWERNVQYSNMPPNLWTMRASCLNAMYVQHSVNCIKLINGWMTLPCCQKSVSIWKGSTRSLIPCHGDLQKAHVQIFPHSQLKALIG